MEGKPMLDEIDWSVTTFEGNRLRQHEEFQALPLREKLKRIEQTEVVAKHFSAFRDVSRLCDESNAGKKDAGRREPSGHG